MQTQQSFSYLAPDISPQIWTNMVPEILRLVVHTSHYLAGGVSAHSEGRGLYCPVRPVDQHTAPGEVFDPVASPRVSLVCAGVHVKSEIKQY